jgi:hypothetical protein
VDEFLAKAQQEQAKQEETNRHNLVMESIGSQNAMSNALYQAGQLGINKTRLVNDKANQTADNAAAQARLDETARHNKATEAAARAKLVQQAKAKGNKPMTAATLLETDGKWKSGINNPPKLGPGWGVPSWDPGTQAWYAKKKDTSASGGAAANNPKNNRPSGDLVTELNKKYYGSGGTSGFGGGVGSSGAKTPGWTSTFGNDPNRLADSVIQWLGTNAYSFRLPSGKADVAKIQSVVTSMKDGARIWSRIQKKLAKRLAANNGVLR